MTSGSFDNPIPAATLVLMRERAGARPQLLMIERAANMAFAAGAMVFPGGRIDPGDRLLAADPARVRAALPLDPDDGAARVAAIRETLEEVGLFVGSDRPDDDALAGQLRAALAAGEDFAALLGAHGLVLELDRLTPFARWRPNMRHARNFDTRFYLAQAPDGAVLADGGESVHAVWTDAQAAIADADAGRHRVIFPTRRNLERLALFGSLAEAQAQAAAFPVRPITPWEEEDGDGRWLHIPADYGYPVTRENVTTAERA